MARLKMLKPRVAILNTVRVRSLPRPSRSTSKALYGSQWQKARLAFLSEHPLCEDCAQEGKTVAATVVDHRIAHRGDLELFWDRDNWAAVCKPHHDRRTANRDGGFGNPTKDSER